MFANLFLKWRWVFEEFRLRERRAQGLPLSRLFVMWVARLPGRLLRAARYAALELRWLLKGNFGLVWRQRELWLQRELVWRRLIGLLGQGSANVHAALSRKLENLRHKFYRLRILYSTAQDEIDLLHHGFSSPTTQAVPRYKARPGSVLYSAYSSLSHESPSDAKHTHELVAGLRKLGFDGHVVTNLKYPTGFPDRGEPVHAKMDIDGVPYRRMEHEGNLLSASTLKRMELNVAAIVELARELRPSILHGALNYLTGLSTIYAAHRLGIPSIYEVRCLSEVVKLSQYSDFDNTLHFAQAVRLETDACMKADRVIAITGAIKNELVRRGVAADKITVVPNGVDTRKFRVRPRDRALASEFDIAERDVVVGYVGSMADYEGLDDLLRAVRGCVDRGIKNVRVLLVGHGQAVDQCFDLAQSLKLGDRVIFTGHIPYEEVESYYSLIDIAPFPRKPLPVCEMVSPLKPLEAMAMGKCVIVSSVAALQEIVGNRDIGLVYDKGDVDSLSRCLERAIVDQSLRQRLGSNARDFVVAERDWAVLAERVADLYRQLGAATGPVPAEVARSQVPSMV